MWDERTRALQRSALREPAPERAPEPAPRREEDTLAELLGNILRVTLETRLADFDPARRTELTLEVRERLLAALGLSPVTPPQGIEPPPDLEPEADPPPPAADPLSSALAQRLEERLQGLGGLLARRADLRQRLVGIALVQLAAGRDVPGASDSELEDLDLLERRARKLELSLEETRAALAYVTGLERVDEGIASIFRHVQGLSVEDPNRFAKRDALEKIFQANVDLQRSR